MGSNTIFPEVSIIIPTYNKSALAIETLNSIASQSYDNWECIIVDDGSTTEDFTALESFAKLDKRFSLFKRPLNTKKGANACRNYGLSISKGDYIQFFDSDDVMLENCLKGRVKAIEATTLDFVVFSMGIYHNDGFKNDDTPDVKVNDWKTALGEFIGERRLPWNLQRTLYRALLIKERLLFNENLSRFQDVEFNIKLLSQLKPKFKIFNKIDCVYRRANSNNPRNKSFNKHVFHSMPIFLESIHTQIPVDILEQKRGNMQLWLLNLIGLYADNSVEKSQLNKVICVAEGKLHLNSKQKIILKLLFLSKTKLKGIKGVVRLNSYLRKKYLKLMA
ncbi:glycosyltransferase family 2 protein [Hyunsoonleella sp. 2307UL5-6]|uniref:glycosyltransferase family 2 protein n=1 Tax=Hyunsoonleella sp. 2307UL5-6 TaxID=3384768 RepID=UPI0039BCC4FC